MLVKGVPKEGDTENTEVILGNLALPHLEVGFLTCPLPFLHCLHRLEVNSTEQPAWRPRAKLTLGNILCWQQRQGGAQVLSPHPREGWRLGQTGEGGSQ